MPVVSTLEGQIKITGAEKGKADLDSVHQSTNKLSDGLKAGVGAAAGFIAGFGGFQVVTDVLEGVKDQLLSVLEAGESQQKVMAQTAAVIKSTGGAAHVSADQVGNYADSLARLTGISDDQIQASENLLLTFTDIKSKTFPQATKVILDMATAMHEDLQSATIQVGKALQDPIAGATALRRVGVQLSEQQQNLIKHFVATGQSAKAQQVILKELTREFGGSAEAAGGTLPGKLAILNVKFDQVKEKIGLAVIPVLEKLLGKYVMPLADWLGDHLPAALNTATGWATNFANGIKYVASHFDEMKPKLAPIAAGIGVLLVGAFVALAGAAWSAASGVIAATWPILAIAAAVAALTAGVIYAYQNWGWFHAAVDLVRTGLGWLKDRIGDLLGFMGNLIGHLVELRNNLMQRLQPAISNVSQKLAELHAWFNNKVLPVLRALYDYFKANILPVLQQVGQWIKDKLQDKLANMWAFIKTYILPILGQLADFVGKSLGHDFQVWGNILGTLFDTIGRLLGQLGKLKTALQSIKMPNLNLGGLHLPGFASGTDDAPGGLAYVHKDELIYLPQHSVVKTAADTRGILSGGGLTGIGSAGAGGREQTIEIYFDSRQMASLIVPQQPRVVRLHGGIKI